MPRAVLIEVTGGPEVLKVVDNYPMPTRKPGQVLVKLHSSSVNPVDTQVRANKIPPKVLPKVLGGDLAGVVVEADEGSKFKKGDHVAALTMGFWIESPYGTYAEYAAVDESDLAHLPDSIPLDVAGGVPLAALTAWQALHKGKVEPGRRALIMAASGGVGHLAVQIGKALGLYVVGVAGPANADWVKNTLGADEVIDYSKQDFAEVYAGNPFDIVVDCLPDARDKCLSVTKPDGHYSHIQNQGTHHAVLEQLQEQHNKGKGPGVTLIFVRPDGAQLQQIIALMEAGKVRLEVAKVFPLSQVANAHQQVETGHTRGKVVLTVP
jgi:NADPH:quinone reductase-like Zn-dependent oxidoreductase